MQSMKIANFKSPLSDVTSITERASVKHRMSHWDNTERICDRAYQNNRSENRTQILDHKVEDLLSFESAIFLGHFFFNLSDAHHTGHQQAGCNGGYWHHHGVCEEVEEIQELHSEYLDAAERTVSQGGQCTKQYHDTSNDQCRFFSSPAELVLECGYGAFCQGYGACQRGTQHKQEE